MIARDLQLIFELFKMQRKRNILYKILECPKIHHLPTADNIRFLRQRKWRDSFTRTNLERLLISTFV